MIHRNSAQNLAVKYGTIFALVLVVTIFSIFVNGFTDSSNLLNVLYQISLLAIIAEGFTMCLIVGELDLSFANVASLSCVMVTALILGGMNPVIAVLIVLALGFSIGMIIGLLVTKIGIPSLITTLAISSVVLGFIYMYTGGVSLYGSMPGGFLFLGRGKIGFIPVMVIIMLIVVCLSYILINKYKIGKHLQATGANKVAARIAGVKTDKCKIIGFILSSFAAALTGVLLSSKLGSASSQAGSGYLMDCFAAALIGETVLIGRANPLGTFVGVLLIGVVTNGMTLWGAPYYMQNIMKGAIILLAVTFTSLQAKKRSME